jgi:GGDEF domain-containing protein
MSSLKLSIFWVTFFLAVILVLAQFDYSDSPIIDFAKYFYFLVLVAVPATIFFPYVSKVNVAFPMVIWGAVYLVLLQILDRTISASDSRPIILLEFILVEAGVWFAHQLAYGINQAESVMDVMALSAFPSRNMDISEASKQIKIEIARSRRYHRPLGLVVIQARADELFINTELVSAIKNDMAHRFSFARIGQIVDEHIRQTDIVFRDSHNRFVVLCPETALQNSQNLAERIADSIYKKTGIQVLWAVAAFPDDALSFDDLLDVANSKLTHSAMNKKEPAMPTENTEREN